MEGLIRTLKDWIDVQSVSGAEADYGDAVARFLGELGFDTERQEVGPGRFNLLARTGSPEVVFCTHLDTVPPWFGPSEDADFVHGRGSCDAKGPALAMIEAARALLAEGEQRIGFLLTVGEELDSAGAKRANERLAEPWKPRFTIVGEPTENTFVSAHKGAFKAQLLAHGVAGHSSQDVGPSAVHELVSSIQRLLETGFGEHPLLGPGTLNIGQIEGGVAPNVVADRAQASLLLRAVEDPETTARRIAGCLTPHVELHCTFHNYGPVEFLVPEGRESMPVAFGTDAPHLGRWGTQLLYGPGRILDAHTDHERLSKSSFERALVDYHDTARDLLAQVDQGEVVS
jgi:acetylornithine deacetylase